MKDRQNKLLRLVSIIFVILLVAYLLIPDSIWTSGFIPIEKRKGSSELRFRHFNGDLWRLDEHVGKVVVVNYWATWCLPCLEEIPYFNKLAREYGNENVQFVGVNVDNDLSVVPAFVERYSISYPIVIPDKDDAIVNSMFLALPTTLIYDKQGRLAKKHVGLLPEATLRSDIEELLNEP